MSSAIIVPPRYAIPSRDQYGPGFRYIQAALQEKDLANCRPAMPSLITTLGGIIAAVCSRCQSQRNYEFAMDRSKLDAASHPSAHVYQLVNSFSQKAAGNY